VEFRKGDLLTEFQSRLNDFLAFYDDQRTPRSSHAQSGSSQSPVQPMSHEQAEVIASVMTAPAPATAGSPA
jgi:hypothetical protein